MLVEIDVSKIIELKGMVGFVAINSDEILAMRIVTFTDEEKAQLKEISSKEKGDKETQEKAKKLSENANYLLMIQNKGISDCHLIFETYQEAERYKNKLMADINR